MAFLGSTTAQPARRTAPAAKASIARPTPGRPGRRVLGGRPTGLSVAASAPTVWYAGIRGDGIYKSTSSGASWIKLAGGLPATPGRIAVAVAPSSPQRLYAVISDNADFGGDLLGAFTSADGGTTWTAVSVPASLSFCKIDPASTAQCDYDLVVTVDPTTSTTFYAGGINLFKFTGAGSTHTQIGGFKNDYHGADVVHVDQHALAFDRSKRLWVGNDGGVYRTADAGTTFANLNATLSITQFTSVSGWLPIGGTQDNGSQFFNGGTQWLQYEGGDGGASAVSPRNERTMYGSFPNLDVFKSLDAGGSAVTAQSGLPSTTPRLSTHRSSWIMRDLTGCTPARCASIAPSTAARAGRR